MKYNEYYNKNVMTFKQLACDLEKQGFTCKLSEDGDYLCVHYLCFLDYVEIYLTDYKDWCVTYYKPFKEMKIYIALTNYDVIKLLRNLLIDTK